ncbi:short transient receptor potential channel 6-like [Gigantopelta aegis]|uniref:short transient receptor potential channel 6-like n=1 Tax=Gigantopelta aegis TaxID=1735272 RepID=UPI001B8894DE|nr:short transient receptor potential channel 6-like [Gigantopelta aegis]
MDIIRMRAKSVEDKKYRLLQDRLEAGLSEGERYFLTAAEIGDIDTLKSLLNEGKVSINCVDPQGRTALELAVAANVEGVVCHLLDKVSGRIVHKAFLCACDYDRDTIFEIILQHPIYARSPSDEDVELTMPLYSKYVTRRNPQVELQDKLREALIRAAKRNNFQIVKQLMLRGATLVLPHDYFCNCNQCTTQRSEDFKVYTSTRLDTFRAMASPAYMVLTEEDPIISAFRHSVNFRKMAEIESEFKLLYNQLDQQVQDFTTDLMDQCHSSDEVKTILSGPIPVQEEGDEVEEDDNDSAILPILTAAIKMGQKKFVAHNQSQAQIAELWYSGVPFLRYLNRFTYLMLAIPIGILLVPVMSVIYLVWPWGKVSGVPPMSVIYLVWRCRTSHVRHISRVAVLYQSCPSYTPRGRVVPVMSVIYLVWPCCTSHVRHIPRVAVLYQSCPCCTSHVRHIPHVAVLYK